MNGSRQNGSPINGKAAVALDDVRKSFGDHAAVDGVSFIVPEGRIFGLLGRNGAGKTTTLRMISGILLPDSGRVQVLDTRGAAEARKRIAYLPEERGLYRGMRVLDQVVFFAEIRGRSHADAQRLARAALARFELDGEGGRKVEELSKGNQQKVQLAGVLVAEPEVVLLDEPMSGLDPVNVVLVREVLQELRAGGRTVILSTHMMAEAERLCDHVCLVHRGRVVLSGSVPEVRAGRGDRAVHLEFDGDPGRLTGLAGVEALELSGRHAELRVGPRVDDQALLRDVMGRVRVVRFELAAPSLEQVFVSAVGEDPAAAALYAAAATGTRDAAS